jgi:predicted ATPase/DNA-binding SARP family transcriptional activator
LSQLTIHLLGAPQVELDGSPITVDTRKAIALLAYLVSTRQVHQRSRLALLFWPDSDQTRARTALRRTLSALTQAIGKEWLMADRESIGLDWDTAGQHSLWVDVHQFEHLAGQCQFDELSETTCRQCQPTLAKAADLYRGDFLAGFAVADCLEFDDWQIYQAEKYRQLYARVLEKLIYCCQLQGDLETALTTARRWVALDPLHEAAQRTLMILYARAGQRSDALRQYQECIRLLQEELGVEPEPETEDLYEQIRDDKLRPESLPTAVQTASASTLATTSLLHNLPHHATPFIGREQERAKIEALLNDPGCRLVTLVGPGGIGKTRLALEAAKRQIGRFAHGVYFVPLGPVSSPTYLVATIAESLQFAFYNGHHGRQQRAQLFDYLQEKELLLVIDNFEHLLEGAEMLSDILRQARAVKILVTSQERLHLQEEWLVEIDGLPCPPSSSPADVLACNAAQLFVERARQVQPTFTLTKEDVTGVADICRLVGGMPLGIELASSWVRMLSCREIAEQIKHSLDFLETSLRNVPERHRSLRAVFERTWQLLSDRERAVFRKLSIFRGGFQVAAAMQVADAPLPLLLALTDKSLLRRMANGRFEIPEVLNQYAQEQWQQQPQPDVEARHGRYYLMRLAGLERDLKGAQQKSALADIGAEIDNVRQAWRWAVANEQVELIEPALLSFFMLYEMQGWFEEGVQACQQALGHFAGKAMVTTTGRLQAVSGAFLVRLSQYKQAQAVLAEALAQLRPLAGADSPHKSTVAFTLYSYGIAAEATGERERALEVLQESLTLYRAENDAWGMGNVLNALGNVSTMLRQPDTAQRYYQESLAIRQQIGDRRGIALCYHNLGNVNQSLGHYDEAGELYRQSVTIKREIGDRRGIGYSLNNLGYMAYLLENYDEALPHLEESLAVLRDVGDRRGIGYALMNLGNVAHAQANPVKAGESYLESLQTLQAIGDRLGIAYAQGHLANVALAHHNHEAAADYYKEALVTAQTIEAVPVMLDALVGLAAVKAAVGKMTTAFSLLAVVLDHQDTPTKTRERAEMMQAEWEEQVGDELPAVMPQTGTMRSLEEIVVTIADL